MKLLELSILFYNLQHALDFSLGSLKLVKLFIWLTSFNMRWNFLYPQDMYGGLWQACSSWFSVLGFCKHGKFCHFAHEASDFGKVAPRVASRWSSYNYRMQLCPAGTRLIVNGNLSTFEGKMFCKMLSPVVFITTSKRHLCV